MELKDGSRVGIVGGGPAGSLTAYFIRQIADRIGTKVDVDIYEPTDFNRSGPPGCNMCGGVVSEALVQMLAVEGINLPSSIVQMGIDSYVLHTAADQVSIRTPLEEMRIAAMFRGGGPRGCDPGENGSFDGYLLGLATELGARHIPSRVRRVVWENELPVIYTNDGPGRSYDLVVAAVGVNAQGVKLFKDLGIIHKNPRTTRTAMMELRLGREKVKRLMGNSMHVFLLDIPRFEFAAMIPKGDYVTVCVLGRDVDSELMDKFMSSAEVRQCLQGEFDPGTQVCRCKPAINLGGTRDLFADRMVLVGDFGVTRLYKDGIGAAYRSAKACAVTVLVHGVSRKDFAKYYWSTPRRIEIDNMLGKLLFGCAVFFRNFTFLRRAMLRLVRREQAVPGRPLLMSMGLWNMFTGSIPYTRIVRGFMRPDFLALFLWACLREIFPGKQSPGSDGPARGK